MLSTKSNGTTRNIDQVFNDFFTSFPISRQIDEKSSTALVNIVEIEKGYQLEICVPGRNKENLSIKMEKNLLTVSFENDERQEKNEQKFIRQEFTITGFKRSFTLDEKINAEAIEAKYENGILKIYLPKKEDVKIAQKEISIQ